MHLLSIRLEGNIAMDVTNTGRGPLLGTDLTRWEAAHEGSTFFRGRQRIGLLRRGASARPDLGWEERGWSAVGNLFLALLTGYVRTSQQADLAAVGYTKRWSATVWMPVRSIGWSWD